VDVIMIFTIPATRAAKNATTAIPIVFAQVLDPVGSGLVASLARPGGNITGSTDSVPELMAKLLELLKEIMPRTRRVAVLVNPDNPKRGAPTFKAMESTRALFQGWPRVALTRSW
jgi:putative ABC transport system substrate-binding protein